MNIAQDKGACMESIQENMNEFRNQLKQGSIQKAYKGLLEYIMYLQAHFKKQYPDYDVTGSIYHGYLDMTYFPIFPKSLKDCSLKIAIVFNYDEFRFEAWLSGKNKKVQQKYWELFRDNQWNKYRLVTTTQGVDSIVECILVEEMDFNDSDALTVKIEKATTGFIDDIERFISAHRA